jgi:hypothetical protein
MPLDLSIAQQFLAGRDRAMARQRQAVMDKAALDAHEMELKRSKAELALKGIEAQILRRNLEAQTAQAMQGTTGTLPGIANFGGAPLMPAALPGDTQAPEPIAPPPNTQQNIEIPNMSHAPVSVGAINATLPPELGGGQFNIPGYQTTPASSMEMHLANLAAQAKAKSDAEAALKMKTDEAIREEYAKQKATAQFRAPKEPTVNTPFEVWRLQHPGEPVENFLKMEQGIKPPKDTSVSDNARNDRSYQFESKRVDDLGKPVAQTAQRLSNLDETLRNGRTVSEALVAPELLSILAGGQASGLKMTDAELNRINGARGFWADLKVKVSKFNPNDQSTLVLSPDQKVAIRKLYDAVRTKVSAKSDAIDQAYQDLVHAESIQDHRSITTRLKQQLNEIDSGKPKSNSPRVVKFDAKGNIVP